MSDIPLGIHRETLLRLPESLFRFRAVSEPVAACNGLVLITPEFRGGYRDNEINCDPEGTWEIRNPLPQQDINSHVLGIGLGLRSADFNVWSLKSSFGVFTKGALHWVSDDDVGTENYCQLTLPTIQMKLESMRLDLVNHYGSQDFFMKLLDLCGQVVTSKRRARKMETTMMQMPDTKLTLCVRDFVKEGCSPRPDRCYSSLYRYNSPSEVRASFTPNTDSTTLPLDVCREIFLHLPAKSLVRFRAVCKSCNIIILNSTGPPFHTLYSFDLDDLKFANGLQKITVAPLNFTPSRLSLLRAFPVSTCNGLILVAGKSLEIWNPLTHDRLKLLRGKCNPPEPERHAIGLGYDYTTDDYKVVVIHGHRLHRRRHGRDNFAFKTHVYILRSDSWRNVENCPIYDDDNSWWGPRGPGVFLYGAFHWAMFNSPYGKDTIVVFDLGTENYRQLQAPPLRKRDRLNVQKRYLNVLDGCLVVSDFAKANFTRDELEHYDVWVMKDYGDKDSWVKLISFENEECEFYGIRYNLRPIAFMKNKTQILLQDETFYWTSDYSCGLFMFDVESDSMKRVGIHGLTAVTLYIQYIPGTIFRLHDNCGVNGSVTTLRRRRRRRRLGKRTSNMKMSDTT
ncbi:hypothetical protein CASFOL_009290 [Castilleja foliolosa]|uniref:F-box domain-containing protein n=1 Tax=Castilleja foliolosa TaxID=1961234 RepID=A0ABD3DWW0_9LAMI